MTDTDTPTEGDLIREAAPKWLGAHGSAVAAFDH